MSWNIFFYPTVRDDAQVIRQCGYIESKHECYKTVLEEYNTIVSKLRGKSVVSIYSILTFFIPFLYIRAY